MPEKVRKNSGIIGTWLHGKTLAFDAKLAIE